MGRGLPVPALVALAAGTWAWERATRVDRALQRGISAVRCPPRRPVGMIQTLKDACRKGMVAASDKYK